MHEAITIWRRLANVGSNSSIDSGQVAFQYWFNGPMDLPDAADPLSQLTMDCLDATTGALKSLMLILCIWQPLYVDA